MPATPLTALIQPTRVEAEYDHDLPAMPPPLPTVADIARTQTYVDQRARMGLAAAAHHQAAFEDTPVYVRVALTDTITSLILAAEAVGLTFGPLLDDALAEARNVATPLPAETAE